MNNKKVNVAIIGLGFGAEFIPIYKRHPHVNMYAICQRDATKLKQIGDAFGIDRRDKSDARMFDALASFGVGASGLGEMGDLYDQTEADQP